MIEVLRRLSIGIFALGLSLACGGCSEDSEAKSEFVFIGEIADSSAVSEENTFESGRESQKIVIYICGAVNTPGVYELEEPARLYEAVEAAGGLTNEAACELINLAQFISDGERIVIPKTGSQSAAAAEQSGSSSGMININTADVSRLMTLPGIGEAKAEAIISYRSSNGAFSSIEEIMKVPGIKTAVFQKIKGMISISG